MQKDARIPQPITDPGFINRTDWLNPTVCFITQGKAHRSVDSVVLGLFETDDHVH